MKAQATAGSPIKGDLPLTATDHSPPATDHSLRVAVVGPCASGKSTLIEALREAGYDARHPAQEHSYVKDMWLRLVAPDILIYLDISYEASRRRRPGQDLGEDGMAEQARRLSHARQHADLYVDTSDMTAEEVRGAVLAYLADL